MMKPQIDDDNITTHHMASWNFSPTSLDKFISFDDDDEVLVMKEMVVKKKKKKDKKRGRNHEEKTREEVESQRMTHIAVERNRRKQMNDHLTVLRSLMPPSYVHRGDQASIIGGAIEFVRELEQLLQCLESQKRRRLCGDDESSRPMGDSATITINQQEQLQPVVVPYLSPNYNYSMMMMPEEEEEVLLPNDHHHHHHHHHHQEVVLMSSYETGGGGGDDEEEDKEERAERKSSMADVEVKLVGLDAIIKVLSRRRPGQLITTIAALEEYLHLHILHTNITTLEQTVLYSFNVKMHSEVRFTAEDIATTVQQIFTFIHANCTTY